MIIKKAWKYRLFPKAKSTIGYICDNYYGDFDDMFKTSEKIGKNIIAHEEPIRGIFIEKNHPLYNEIIRLINNYDEKTKEIKKENAKVLHYKYR